MNFALIISFIVFHLTLVNTLPSRIINGFEVKIEDVPFQVALYVTSNMKSWFTCGGAILSYNFAITAAHCVEFPDGVYHIIVGTSRLDNESGKVILVEKAIIHPHYSNRSSDYDFALLLLRNFGPLLDVIKFAKLPTVKDDLNIGEEVFVTGWGTMESGGSPVNLRGANVEIYDFEKCFYNYSLRAIEITNQMFCAGFEEGYIDSCTGDSGGPAIRVSDGTLIGLTSFGIGCGKPHFPGVYAKISSILKWIHDMTNLKEI